MHASSKIEKRISIAMRTCVAVAAVIMLFGFTLLLINYEDNFAGFSYPWVVEALAGLATLNPYSYMSLGIFVLILTPIIRVAVSIILFAKEKDKLYVLITLLVLIILLISFLVGFFIR